MAADKKYNFKITAEVVDEEGVEMFDANVTYKNMGYDDVVLVEKALIEMLSGLNKFAEAKISKK